MLQIDRQFLRDRRKATGGRNRFGQRTGPDIDRIRGNAKMLIRAAPTSPEHTRSMRFVDQQKETEFFFHFQDLGQMANVPVHGKNTVRDNQCAVGLGSVLQFLAQG